MVKIIITFLTIALLNCANAQNIDSLLSIQRQFDPQEKTYVQFDKDYYNPGETIWFKAYLFTGIDPSIISTNFYAELLDENGIVISSKTAPVIKSSAASSFDLPEKLSNHVLYFRAYTTSQLNGDTSFLFVKPIQIISSALLTAANANVKKVPTIRFLPESGDWVAGLSSHIAFKATDENNLPIKASGYIKDDQGVKILDFNTVHDGMGEFAIIPEVDKTYTAVWNSENQTYTTPLPAVKKSGIVLHITDEPKGRKFLLQRSANSSENLQSVKIIGYMNQQVAFTANVDLSKENTAQGILPTAELPSGLLQFTVFDKNRQPVAERITFINNHDFELPIDISLVGKNLAKRGLNEFEITVSDSIPANVSVSITDADLNRSSPFQDNIISTLLLTGDLHGKVIDPYYYFVNTSDSVAKYLDLVMLTNGWRRYNWDHVFAGTAPKPRFKESNYISLQGQLKLKNFQNHYTPKLQLKGTFTTADSSLSFITLPIAKNGDVFVDSLMFFDKAKMKLHFSDKKLDFDNTMLTLDNGLLKPYKGILLDSNLKKIQLAFDTSILSKNISATILALNEANKKHLKDHQLQNVTVKAKAKSAMDKMDSRYTSGLFENSNAIRLDVLQDQSAFSSQTVFHYLRSKVVGLDVSIKSLGGIDDQVTLTWRGNHSIMGGQPSPALFLNEMSTTIEELQTISMTDVAYIKLFRPGQTGAISMTGAGAIAVYTKKGNEVSVNPNDPVPYVELMGYSPVKEFLSPEYTTDNTMADVQDVRTTLYWNPDLLFSKEVKTRSLKFYNNDITHRFKLIMEGINDAGKLVHVEKIIE